MKMYKDDQVCNVDKDQRKKMKAAGWSKKRPDDFVDPEGSSNPENQVDGVVFECVECGAEYENEKPEVCQNILEEGDEDNEPTICNSETFMVKED